ncbi:hypothetical protein BGZ89_009036 [Linnemannia elongata]|nr:hypothetical protein BGZ89_009036 [Linnemannia elongata]
MTCVQNDVLLDWIKLYAGEMFIWSSYVNVELKLVELRRAPKYVLGTTLAMRYGLPVRVTHRARGDASATTVEA